MTVSSTARREGSRAGPPPVWWPADTRRARRRVSAQPPRTGDCVHCLPLRCPIHAASLALRLAPRSPCVFSFCIFLRVPANQSSDLLHRHVFSFCIFLRVPANQSSDLLHGHVRSFCIFLRVPANQSSDLLHGRVRSFRVFAVNAGGDSPDGEEAAATTAAGPPDPPQPPKVSRCRSAATRPSRTLGRVFNRERRGGVSRLTGCPAKGRAHNDQAD